MAPSRPAAAAAAAAAADDSPEALEVRCAGCGETLEVEPGLTEFICPDCAMPQSLPPELMPPPPPRRKALPLPRSAADVRGARLPCGACGALLSVPVGLASCACPICGAELAVDTARLRQYLLASAAAEGAVPVVPIGTSSAPPILQVREVHQEHPTIAIRTGLIQSEPNNQLNRMEQAELDHPDYMIGEELHEVSEIITRHNKQRNRESVDPRTMSAEKRQEEHLNQLRHQPQDKRSSYTFLMKQSHRGYRERFNEAQPEAIDSTVFNEPGRSALNNGIAATCINCTTVHSAGPNHVNIDKMQAPTSNAKKFIQPAQKQPSYVVSPENAQDEQADDLIHVQEKQRGTVNQVDHRQEACAQLDNETVAGDSRIRRVRCSVGPRSTVTEKRQVGTANEAIKQVQMQQSDSVIHMELGNQVFHVEKEQLEPFSCIHKRKMKDLMAATNSGRQLRCRKCLAKDLPPQRDKQHDKNMLFEPQVSQNDQVAAAAMNTESIHGDPVERRDASSAGPMPATITESEPTESEPDELYAPSPYQNLSNSPDIDRIINRICPTSSPRHEMPEKGTNEFDNFRLTTQPLSSHIDMSDPEHFACNYVPQEVRKALGKLKSNLSFEHGMSQASSGEVHELSDPEGQDEPWTMAHQNVGTDKNQGRGRGFTLCLKVWTMPKGVRIPVLLNASGEPVGKEAGTLANFLGAIARDGILAPLTHQDWRRVPEKNKDVMCHIVKLKFDIAPVGEFWILKCLGKKWKSWKALLKQKHYDTHETVEERLADQNPRVLKEQWQYLVTYWGTEKAKAASSRNKACRAKVTATHTAGTKSFARIIEEERQKRPNKEPTPEDLFILTHTHKNGKPVKKAKADIIARLHERSRKQAECSGSESTSHNIALESCSNGLQGKRGRRKAVLQASFKDAEAAKQRAENEAAALRKKVMAMEASQKKLQEDLANMKSTVSAMQKTTSTGDLRDEQMGRIMPARNIPDEPRGERLAHPGFTQVQNAQSSHEVMQPYLDYSALYDSSASPGQQFR